MSKELIEVISNNFNLSRLDSQLDTESAYLNALQVALIQKILFFIRTDVDRLLQILYRIDVHQKDTDAAFELGDINLISSELAKVIIQRQLQKIEYAKNFNKGDDS